MSFVLENRHPAVDTDNAALQEQLDAVPFTPTWPDLLPPYAARPALAPGASAEEQQRDALLRALDSDYGFQLAPDDQWLVSIWSHTRNINSLRRCITQLRNDINNKAKERADLQQQRPDRERQLQSEIEKLQVDVGLSEQELTKAHTPLAHAYNQPQTVVYTTTWKEETEEQEQNVDRVMQRLLNRKAELHKAEEQLCVSQSEDAKLEGQLETLVTRLSRLTDIESNPLQLVAADERVPRSFRQPTFQVQFRSAGGPLFCAAPNVNPRADAVHLVYRKYAQQLIPTAVEPPVAPNEDAHGWSGRTKGTRTCNVVCFFFHLVPHRVFSLLLSASDAFFDDRKLAGQKC
jgi:phosphotransferase system IIB component